MDMKAMLPCHRLQQLSLFATPAPVENLRHTWHEGICRTCGLSKDKAIAMLCDCGCRTPITEQTPVTTYKDLIFVLGHETIDMFEIPPLTT
jgi:hypothetical protein